MRTNAQEAILSAYFVSIGKLTPRDPAQAAPELCRITTSLNRLQFRPHRAARAAQARPTNPDQGRAETSGLGPQSPLEQTANGFARRSRPKN